MLLLIFHLVAKSQDSTRIIRPNNVTDTANRQTTRVIVGDVYISGNTRTKFYIVQRELLFKKGDTVLLSDLVKSFVRSREQLINTHLFNEAVIYLKEFRGLVADIQVQVKERWYIFPLPYVRPVDRNLSAWADQGYSLSRLNYGLKYSQYNFTGRNDNLRIWAITGYSRQLEMAYDLPYIDKSLKHGFGFGVSYVALPEINISTQDNKQQFLAADTIPYAGRFLREQVTVNFRYYYRPAVKTRHYFRLGFVSMNVDSAVFAFNPGYLFTNKSHLFFPELSYVMNYNNVDYLPYPLKGFLFEAGFLQRGISKDMHMTQVYVKSIRSWPVASKTYFGLQGFASVKLPFDQPFYNASFLGYGDAYMRGLEKYVIDGVAGVLARNTLTQELFNFSIPFLHSNSHDRIPFRIFAKTYFDWAYAYNKIVPENSFTNRMLYTGGVGIDVVTFYDLVFRFEYSFTSSVKTDYFYTCEMIFNSFRPVNTNS